jgi:hypothetical protein
MFRRTLAAAETWIKDGCGSARLVPVRHPHDDGKPPPQRGRRLSQRTVSHDAHLRAPGSHGRHHALRRGVASSGVRARGTGAGAPLVCPRLLCDRSLRHLCGRRVRHERPGRIRPVATRAEPGHGAVRPDVRLVCGQLHTPEAAPGSARCRHLLRGPSSAAPHGMERLGARARASPYGRPPAVGRANRILRAAARYPAAAAGPRAQSDPVPSRWQPPCWCSSPAA